MEFKKYYLTKNDCYKKATKITPKGIVVHSTGVNNPNLKRYVGPDDGILGVNKNNNDWNRANKLLVHAFIGKDKNGVVRCYNTLPFNYAAWGVGKGSKGSYNYNPTGYIQFEICEDALKDKKYFEAAFDLAAEFCAYLMKTYNIKIDNVVSHHEAHLRGYASNHGDCDNWLKKFGKDMKWFRSEVTKKLTPAVSEKKEETENKPVSKFKEYLVEVIAKELNVRAGAGTKYKVNTKIKKGQVYTIVDEKSGWGKLKSGAGWIYLKYTKKK